MGINLADLLDSILLQSYSFYQEARFQSEGIKLAYLLDAL